MRRSQKHGVPESQAPIRGFRPHRQQQRVSIRGDGWKDHQPVVHHGGGVRRRYQPLARRHVIELGKSLKRQHAVTVAARSTSSAARRCFSPPPDPWRRRGHWRRTKSPSGHRSRRAGSSSRREASPLPYACSCARARPAARLSARACRRRGQLGHGNAMPGDDELLPDSTSRTYLAKFWLASRRVTVLAYRPPSECSATVVHFLRGVDRGVEDRGLRRVRRSRQAPRDTPPPHRRRSRRR